MSPPERPVVNGADEARLVELYEEHFNGLCRLAALLLNDARAAEEVVQDAFVRTYVGWWRLRRPERAQFYLRAAVVNGCRSRQRRSSYRREELTGEEMSVSEDHDAYGVSDERGRVRVAIDQLAPRQRETVILTYYADLGETEVAAALGCSVGTVKSQLAKARHHLRGFLDEESA